MNEQDVLGAFLLGNNPIVLSEEETKDVQKAIKHLRQENKILKENAENNDKVVDKVNWENQLLKKEIHQLKEEYNKIQKAYESTFSDYQQLKDNWNKLKECLKDVVSSCDADDKDFVETILDIMQEIERSDNQ